MLENKIEALEKIIAWITPMVKENPKQEYLVTLIQLRCDLSALYEARDM